MRFIVFFMFLLTAAEASAAVVVRRSGALSPLGDALMENLRKTPIDGAGRIVELSGDSAADAARVARECEKAQVVFTIGAEAATAVSAVSARSSIIALGVPNPARLGVAATYVSAYPRLEAVIEYTSTRLKAKRIGLLHSPNQNREIVALFQKAATAKGATIVPIAAGSSGELVRALATIGADVDVLILAIDPLVFDRQALRFVVEKATAAKKPTIGFLPELASLGVTIALTNDAASVAASAVNAVKTSHPGTRGTAEVDGLTIVASKRAAELIGIPLESLGAHQTR